MRVGHPASNPVPGNEAPAAKAGGRAGAAAEARGSGKKAAVEGGKTVTHGRDANSEISSKSKRFATAKAVATDAPDVREDKIAEFKKRISEGSYKVDSDAVADRLVNDHLSLIGE